MIGGHAVRRKFDTFEEEHAYQLDKAIRNRESIARIRLSRSENLARVRSANEARMEAAIEARAKEIAERIAKMRAAKTAWMMNGHATINLPESLVKHLEFD